MGQPAQSAAGREQCARTGGDPEGARQIGAKTQRERDYIDAMALLYTDYDKTPYRTRLMAHVKAMEALAQRYPQDDEAQIAYAILLNVSAPLGDKTYAQQLKGAAILEPISQRLPLHPGVTHYLIHLYDYPPLAQKGLAAANRYAKIAPAAPHAQHMPSHIYTRVGYWKESIAANIGSVKAAKAEKSVGSYLHAQDYMVYAHLQLAQDKQARAVMDEMMKDAEFQSEDLGRQLCVGRRAGALCGRARRLERSGTAGGPAERLRLIIWRSRTLPGRSGPPAPAIRRPPRPTSPSWQSFATSCARPRTPIGRRSSISSGRSRPPGCCMPKASTTRRCAR